VEHLIKTTYTQKDLLLEALDTEEANDKVTATGGAPL
jgi:hypothetical protein